MGRLQTIENALSEINESVFQELCDSFLFVRHRHYIVFSRSGSQSGKQKTVKGTPDMYLLLHDGKYIFVEYSTNVSLGVKKLEEDLQKCLDSSKTAINTDDINEIIFCVNFKLRVEETDRLKNIISTFSIGLTIYTLDSLALELKLHHRNLVSQYLGLPLDTGQVVSIDSFVTEHNRVGNGIATPLDNTFLHREKELEHITSLINSNDFVLLSGPAGVGKTKLALEVMKAYVLANPSYQTYCISYKHCALLEDLHGHLSKGEMYVLLVDDANRLDALGQIIGFYKSFDSGRLKIIMTTRDYALIELIPKLAQFRPSRFSVEKFSDEQIIDIIRATPFEILNHKYHAEILRIAEGNPRIAIMTALLAKEKQDVYALTDVSELFETYFNTFAFDISDIASDLNVESLGLISFFSVIPYKDRNTTSAILNCFGIDYSEFVDAIDRMERLELVEIKYGNVKISEQNLSTYFFYKAFVALNLLSFEILLNNFFNKNHDRFRECVVSVNNTFGPERVMGSLQPHLKKYFYKLEYNSEARFKFLKIFWFYLKVEALEFIFLEIKVLPVCETDKYEVAYESNAFSYNKDRFIELIGEMFRYPDNLRDAIELGFEYVKKKPEHLPEYIHKVRQMLTFDKDDLYTDFFRQVTLFDIILNGFHRKELIYIASFYELSKTFLEFKFEHMFGGRNQSYSWYHYPIPSSSVIKAFRKRIWGVVFENFGNHHSLSFDLLQHYSAVRLDVSLELMTYDRQFILKAIDKHLSPENFEHCLYVQDKFRAYRRIGLFNRKSGQLAKRFVNEAYDTFKLLSWNFRRNKDDYEFDNHADFERLKEEDIRQSFLFRNSDDALRFYGIIVNVMNRLEVDHGFQHSIDLVVDANLSENFNLGILLLKLITDANNEIKYVPDIAFANHLEKSCEVSQLWQLTANSPFNLNSDWRMSFFNRLNDSLISETYLPVFLSIFANENQSFRTSFNSIQKFKKVKSDIANSILKIVTERNDKQTAKFCLGIHFFEDHFNELADDFDLIEYAYIQQRKIQSRFDYSGQVLLKILQQKKWFLLQYIEETFKDDDCGFSRDLQRFEFVWGIEDIEAVLEKVFDTFRNKNDYFGVDDHFFRSFFQNLKVEFIPRAKAFLLGLCKVNFEDVYRMNIILDVTRIPGLQIMNEILLAFLKSSQDVENFSEIVWFERSRLLSGDVISADLEAADWRNILSILESANLGIKILPIKKRINHEIDRCLKSADLERQQRFLGGY